MLHLKHVKWLVDLHVSQMLFINVIWVMIPLMFAYGTKAFCACTLSDIIAISLGQ